MPTELGDGAANRKACVCCGGTEGTMLPMACATNSACEMFVHESCPDPLRDTVPEGYWAALHENQRLLPELPPDDDDDPEPLL